ncbi:DNA fragmentation factor subunit alpha-like [Antedon mediterranea]|uniref:DNA fragmentation factor subunit alpha-like n=1 Tax=Antedon mediterranea TaxID=105859 RepID=UPI003AF42D10
MDRKPLKVCNADRTKQIGVTASTITDIVEKVKKYFNVQNDRLTIVEDIDGTILEDDEYFQSLPKYVLLMALADGQTWTAKRSDIELVNTQGTDQTDSTEKVLSVVAKSIKKNPARIPLLTKHELQILTDATAAEIIEITKMRSSEVNDLQQYCNKRLREDDELKDGIEILKLYKQAKH